MKSFRTKLWLQSRQDNQQDLEYVDYILYRGVGQPESIKGCTR